MPYKNSFISLFIKEVFQKVYHRHIFIKCKVRPTVDATSTVIQHKINDFRLLRARLVPKNFSQKHHIEFLTHVWIIKYR